MDSIKSDFLIQHDEFFQLIQTILIVDVVTSGDSACWKERRLLDLAGIGEDLAWVLSVVGLQLGSEFLIDNLECERALALEEGVHPFRIRRSRNLNQNLIGTLQSDIRLGYTKLVDSLVEYGDILSYQRGRFKRGRAVAGPRRVCFSVGFQQDAHTSTQVESKLQYFATQSLQVKQLGAIGFLQGIEHILFGIEASE
jgi:hypothetical protein